MLVPDGCYLSSQPRFSMSHWVFREGPRSWAVERGRRPVFIVVAQAERITPFGLNDV